MATMLVTGASVGTALQQLLMADDIEPGAEPGYQTCKIIYLYHPLGAKMAEAPIKMAQSQAREISVGNAPERVKQAFIDERDRMGADKIILNLETQTRVYGVASVVLGARDFATDKPLTPEELVRAELFFNVMDPLNTAGSLVLNQDPNAPDFQKHGDVVSKGVRYHRSRALVRMNEQPIYIAYTASAFGFVGRSVYQRGLFPLKSFVNTMITDDMVARKAGLLIAMLQQAGSVIDNAMQRLFGVKRALLKEAGNDNVLSIGLTEKIETLNMQNVNTAMAESRNNILKNIAMSDDMPAKFLENETMIGGMAEGTEDAKMIAHYIDRKRVEMQPSYAWFDNIVQYRAWNKEFYETIKVEFPDEYGSVDFITARTKWRNDFRAVWPSLLTEPDSEKAKVSEIKYKSAVAAYEVFEPGFSPANKAKLNQWLVDTINNETDLFETPLEFDMDEQLEYLESLPPPPDPAVKAEAEPPGPQTFSQRA